MPAHTDPFSPENVLVIANGLLTGAPVSTATRYIVSARSPLTNGYGRSEAGGFWGPELKMAGFEAIVVKGQAPEPVYLWIQDGEVEIRLSQHIYGAKRQLKSKLQSAQSWEIKRSEFYRLALRVRTWFGLQESPMICGTSTVAMVWEPSWVPKI